MRVLVTGSRELTDPSVVYDALYLLKEAYGASNMIVIHGDCPSGADLYAKRWCHMFPDVTEERYPADWERHGKAAGHIRNKQMVDTEPDLVLAFPRGEARGTMNCVQHAQKAGIAVVFG